MSDAKPFLFETVLNADTLSALANREINAIRVKEFYPASLCNSIVDRMMASTLYGAYENAPHIGRIGQAFFESQVSSETSDRYWKHSLQWIREMRDACSPYLTPIDKLRLECDEIWPAGATVASLDKHRMFVGLARVFKAHGNAEPHQDILAWDAPGHPDTLALKSQLAANTYLRLADAGGGLTLWPVELTKDEYEALRYPNSYGVDTSSLVAPLATIQPEVGELVLFDSRRLHAVQITTAGFRVTWSNFIGIEGNDKPLKFWS